MSLKLGGHRGFGSTDHGFYQSERDIQNMPVENTLESVKAAFAAGADYIETDALLSKDGIIFTLHNVVPKDHFFDTTIPHDLLNQINLADIQKYKTGRTHQGNVATMQDMLVLISRLDPKTLPWAINIEIKGVQGSGQPYEQNDYIKILADTIKNSPLPAERILWSSFTLENILRMSHHLPKSKYAMLFAEQGEPKAIFTDHQDNPHYRFLQFDTPTIDYVWNEWQQYAANTAKLEYMHPEIMSITKVTLDAVSSKGLGINCWALFEELNETRKAYYKAITEYAAQKNVPFTVITDYLPEMQELTL